MRGTQRAKRESIPGMQWIWAVVIALIVAGVVTFGWAWDHWEAMQDRALFGDMLSGVAGAFAFIGLIIALILQTMELRAQRRDLRYTQDEIWESRKESKAQTTQFRAQAETMEEQVKVTRIQNALLERQLMLTHQPLLGMSWERTEGGASLVMRNEGHGQALLTKVSYGTPNWKGLERTIFRDAIEGHYRVGQSPTVELRDVEPGTLVGPDSRVEIMNVKGTNKALTTFGGFSICVEFMPAQGGPKDTLQRTVGGARELVE